MLWLLFALLAPLIWACSNLIDDDLVLHRLRNPNVLVGITGLFAGAPALYLFATRMVDVFSWQIACFGVLVGVLSLLVYYPYFRALESTHPANVILLWNVSPILVAVFAFLFLGERLSFVKYFAIGLILLSTVIIETVHANEKKHKMELKAFYWMLLASFGAALQVILEKRLYMESSTASGIAFISIGSFITGSLFFLFRKNRLILKQAFSKSGNIILLNQCLEISAVVFASIAISLGPVSLVTAIGGSQAIMIMFLSMLFSKLFTRKQFRLAKSPPLDRVMIACALVVVGLMMIA